MRIVLDAFGGDNAPFEPIKCARMCTDEKIATMILAGNEDKIKKSAKEFGISLDGIEIANADFEIEMCDDPMSILKSKKNSSMGLGISMVIDGTADAVISGGSTGALAVGATFIAKRINGIKRTALCPILPSATGPMMLLDSGANAECKPEHLLQFGIMGSIYMQKIHNIENPRVGLLNIGAEDSKGGTLQKEAFALLKEADINFVGNVEARDVMYGVCDVLVADGFSGNIFLKSVEGMASYLLKLIKGKFKSNLKTKIAGLMMKKSLYDLKKDFDYTQYGGAIFLGSRAPVIKVHGNSNANTMKNAVIQAVNIAENKMIDEIAKKIKESRNNEGIKKEEENE
jgi:glycerol-3-phosphate acyltransferase PlsX